MFDRPYEVGGFTEIVRPGAFTATLNAGAQVHLLYGHGGLPLASTNNNSLRLSQDKTGLHVDATLDPDDPDSAAVARRVQSGMLKEMSMAFIADEQRWDPDFTQRELLSCDLDKGDVSVVGFGASPTTSVKADGTTDAPMLWTRSAVTLEQRRARAEQVGRRVVIVESRGFGLQSNASTPTTKGRDMTAYFRVLRNRDNRDFMLLQRMKLERRSEWPMISAGVRRLILQGAELRRIQTWIRTAPPRPVGWFPGWGAAPGSASPTCSSVTATLTKAAASAIGYAPTMPRQTREERELEERGKEPPNPPPPPKQTQPADTGTSDED